MEFIEALTNMTLTHHHAGPSPGTTLGHELSAMGFGIKWAIDLTLAPVASSRCFFDPEPWKLEKECANRSNAYRRG